VKAGRKEAPKPSAVALARFYCSPQEQIRADDVSSMGFPTGGRETGRGILLWLLGVPIPIIILVLLFWH
jgi:hypothetical protein